MTAFFTGDASLRRRPMARVTEPLSQMGAALRRARRSRRRCCRWPSSAPRSPMPIEYRLPVASAQVKSAILLAGLNTAGHHGGDRAGATRDHTEPCCAISAPRCDVIETPGGGKRITLVGQPELTGARSRVPGDPSSAAFRSSPALIVPGSRSDGAQRVGLNPLRAGARTRRCGDGRRRSTLGQPASTQAGEPVGDLRCASSKLRGIEVPAARAPSMIDEYPILAVAASCATGPHGHEGPGRAARQGKRPPGRHRPGAGRNAA
jgi:3-phosphoshikimate 1-carboxyvinyltransferase